jgi:alcohol dehydrogenase (cytochrome c)
MVGITRVNLLPAGILALGLASCAMKSDKDVGAANTKAPATAALSADWPSYSNGLDGQRFSPLTQITPDNAASLKKVCSLRLGDDGPFQTGPLVVADTMFVTTSHTTVALDAANCDMRWRTVNTPDEVEAWPVNRGAAYLDGKVFRGTNDGRLIALDAKTGALIWKTKIGDPTHGEAVPSAPVAWNGMVFVGLAVGDFGTRGRMMAYDAATGHELWRFDTVPAGKQAGAASWTKKPTALTGGGATWSSYTIDTERGEVFIPVANPSPALAPGYRPGDNLYTDSLLVLDARTGALKWYYQLIANDGHDWDLGAPAALYENDAGRKIAVIGGKDGYAYGIDRDTHKLTFKTPVTTISNVSAPLTAKGVFVCPGYVGGVEWNGPAFDPVNKAVYVGSVDWCAVYRLGKVKLTDGRPDLGGDFYPKGPATGWVTALDGTTGKELWRYHAESPIVAGVTPTAGGVVFTGAIGGDFLALDSRTGKLLLKSPIGGAMAGGVVTYATGGRQYVAATSGNLSKFTFPGFTGSPTIVVMAVDAPALGDKTVGAPDMAATRTGAQIYQSACATCHGGAGQGASATGLIGIAKRQSIDDIMGQIRKPRGTMPKLYPEVLSDTDVKLVAAYIDGF